MGHCDESMKLPIINFSNENMNVGTKFWEFRCNEIREAFEEYGCFEAFYGNDDLLEIQKNLFQELEEMFSVSSEIKSRFTSPKPYWGYVANIPDNPLYEAMVIDDALDYGSLHRFVDLVCPQANPTFSNLLHEYTTKVSVFEKMVRRMVLESLGVEKLFESQEKSAKYALRLSKYEAPMTKDYQVGARIHFDKNFITILCDNHIDGLQVQRKDGIWIRASPSPSSIVVMTGETFFGWSNGRLHCPLHQVMINGNKTRYSIGLFSSVEGIIQTPKELVDDQHPLLFKPFEEIGLLKVLHKILQDKQNSNEDQSGADTADFLLNSCRI